MMTLHQLPDPSSTAGFFDPRAARVAIRRIGRRRALMDVRASVDALLNCLDQRLQDDGRLAAALADGCADLAPGDGDGVERGDPAKMIHSKDMREQELLHGVKLVLKFFGALDFGLQHGLFSNDGRDKDVATSSACQRLCRGPEKSQVEPGIGGDR
jgi:hypothetical protein